MALLVAAIFVAIIARRVRLPYTVGLVIAGIGLALARVETETTLTHDFIFDVILPPLLFDPGAIAFLPIIPLFLENQMTGEIAADEIDHLL